MNRIKRANPNHSERLRREALEQLKHNPGQAGICGQCGCTENNACIIEGLIDDEPCGWANKERNLCSNPDCLKKAGAVE